ncbi:hypothetical protein A6764_00045 [Brevibacillus sp. WF146]|uniref:hypothetical protein n=1 Tax=Brevibacillus sp. WF146 TaxID=319501 RepID=UPI0007ECDF96|nr:hypothetical protein [Brevibacillus sp. WF146]UYZ12187.1 hypothetical protein A6764_15290 [Brevibacillus sp. WF146]UYZ13436.1 hypothetical protein A6764_00045 [Brevibacillus sp. WF146]
MTTKPNGITPEELTAIRERAEKATPGPWLWSGAKVLNGKYMFVPQGSYLADTLITFGDTYENGGYDAEFIAHAREDIPRLLAEIERLRTALEEINRAWYEDSTDYDFAMKVRTILDKSGFRKGE